MASVNSSGDFIPYQTERLVLLVGENPLPNLVAALLLGKKDGWVTLIYSQGTVENSLDLRHALVKLGYQVNYWQVDESNPVSIHHKVVEALQYQPTRAVGLHYTGGTKAMAVHAYSAVSRWAAANGARAVFSYLDARKLQLVIDPTDPESGEQPVIIPTAQAVSLSLRDLFELHGWREQSSERDLRLPRTTAALAELHFSLPGGNAWRRWKRDILRPRAFSGEDCKSRADLADVTLGLGGASELRAVKEAFAADTGLDPELFRVIEAAQTAGISSDHGLEEGLLKYFDGAWLEMHVLAVLQDLAQRHPGLLTDLVRNLETSLIKFEIDVLGMRGYQLFCFSCTSGAWEHNKGNLKKRLFEASVRARQIGGDEARVALVCLFERPQEIEKEMAEMIGGISKPKYMLNPRIKVFGRPQLQSLADEFASWIMKSSNTEY